MTCRRHWEVVMEKSKLNEMLLEHFPELKVEFDNQTSWQEGMDTGCTVTYADVFAPFAAEVTLSTKLCKFLKNSVV